MTSPPVHADTWPPPLTTIWRLCCHQMFCWSRIFPSFREGKTLEARVLCISTVHSLSVSVCAGARVRFACQFLFSAAFSLFCAECQSLCFGGLFIASVSRFSPSLPLSGWNCKFLGNWVSWAWWIGLKMWCVSELFIPSMLPWESKRKIKLRSLLWFYLGVFCMNVWHHCWLWFRNHCPRL